MGGLRYANIGIGVGITIILMGVLVFRNKSEAAMQAVAMIGFISAFVVFHGLDEWAKRRKGKDPQ